MGIKKRRISLLFPICWKSFEKMYKKKDISKTVTEIALFSLLLMFVKLDLPITFFRGIFFTKNVSKNQKTYFVNVS